MKDKSFYKILVSVLALILLLSSFAFIGISNSEKTQTKQYLEKYCTHSYGLVYTEGMDCFISSDNKFYHEEDKEDPYCTVFKFCTDLAGEYFR